MFKKKFIPNEEPLRESIYRKYNGGDEFIILIKGEQHEAIGFLNRLHRQLDIFSEKTINILPEKFKVTFHAGIASLYADDDDEIALSRVEECFRIAKRKDSKLRIKWVKNPNAPEVSPYYTQASEIFKKD